MHMSTYNCFKNRLRLMDETIIVRSHIGLVGELTIVYKGVENSS